MASDWSMTINGVAQSVGTIDASQEQLISVNLGILFVTTSRSHSTQWRGIGQIEFKMVEEVLGIKKKELEHTRAYVSEVAWAKQRLEERVKKLRTQVEDNEAQS